MPPLKRALRQSRSLRAIDIFSGCGGLTLGLKLAGFRVIGAVDSDPLAVSTYKRNHRSVRIWESDIRRLSVSELMRTLKLKPGQLDLLAGCPPCQGFSSLRTLNGSRRMKGGQNRLLFDFLRFARVLRPRAIMLENVPGLAENWRLQKVATALRRLGYFCKWRVLNAADYGVPQRRRRLIFMATSVGEPEFAPVDPDRVTVREAIAKLSRPGTTGDPCHDLPERRGKRIGELIRRIPVDGGSRAALGLGAQLDCHQSCDGFKDVYGRMAWDDVAPTITGGCVNPSKGRFLHPSQHRAITLREAAILQGFPQSYWFSLSRGKFPTAQMIGNALPPEFIRRHAGLLRGTLLAARRR